jgi:formate dehydrogenase subunit gamma
MIDMNATLQTILSRHGDRDGALLPVLHEIQDALGYVPAEAVPLIAKALNLARAEVHGVLTYYRHFRQTPPGRHVVRICRAEACQSVGADALAAHAEKRLGCGFDETTPDGLVTLEAVYCLGQCAVGPALLIDETAVHAAVGPDRFDALIDALEPRK